jgi:hypothetical protein
MADNVAWCPLDGHDEVQDLFAPRSIGLPPKSSTRHTCVARDPLRGKVRPLEPSDPLASDKLTTWAAGSESPVVEFVRTTIGPLLLILSTPPAAIMFWIVCTFQPFNGALAPLLTTAGWRSVFAHWPWPSTSAAAIVFVFVAVEGILLQWLPGKIFEGPITPTGNRPRYKLNGIRAWFVTHAAFFGCSFGLHLFEAGIVWDQFGEILATLVLFALLFCLFLYFKGRY